MAVGGAACASPRRPPPSSAAQVAVGVDPSAAAHTSKLLASPLTGRRRQTVGRRARAGLRPVTAAEVATLPPPPAAAPSRLRAGAPGSPG